METSNTAPQRANHNRFIANFVQVVDENYWVLVSTPEDALASFVHDFINSPQPLYGDETVPAKDCWEAVGILIGYYTQHDLWGAQAMYSESHPSLKQHLLRYYENKPS